MQLIKSNTNVANYHKPLRLVDSLIFEICSNGHIAREIRQTKKYKKNRWEIFNQYHFMLWCLGCGLQTNKQTNKSNVCMFVCFVHKLYKDWLIVSKNKKKLIYLYEQTLVQYIYIYISRVRTLYRINAQFGSFVTDLFLLRLQWK